MDWLKSKQKVKLQGKYNFQLVVNIDSIDSSSTVSITSFTDASRRAAVPCTYIWFVIKNGLPQEVGQFRGCTFICDTSHIGYYLQAHVISNDPEYSGKAIVTMGPVELDVSLKAGVLGALSRGVLEVPVYFVSEKEQKEGTLQLYDSVIKLTHNFSDANYSFDYSILEPQITPNTREVVKASIFFNEKYESQMRRFQNKLFGSKQVSASKSYSYMGLSKSTTRSQGKPPKLQIKFLSRAARDCFLFSIKAFVAKKQLKNSAIVRKLENINFEKQQDFSMILQLDNLKRDVQRYDRLYKQILNDKKKLMEDCSRLEKQAERRNLDMTGNANYSAATRRDDLALSRAEQENVQLRMKLKRLADDLDLARNCNTSVSNYPRMALSPSVIHKDDESIVCLLDDLNRGDTQRFQRLQSEKKLLTLQLQRSFDKIGYLQNKLAHIPSATGPIHFSYQQQPNDQMMRLQTENQQLKKTVQQMRTNQKIQKESRIQSHLSNIRSQNRNTDLLIQSRIQQQRASRIIDDRETLKTQLSKKQQDIQKLQQKCINLQRRIHQLQQQLQFIRKHQDVFNRSQNLSAQMENFNEQQINLLKGQNQFLIQQNEKLGKACEKYMAEARQNNKLRQEIIDLKMKVHAKMTNPETNSFLA